MGNVLSKTEKRTCGTCLEKKTLLHRGKEKYWNIAVLLNQALVPLDRVSKRRFCRRCISHINWRPTSTGGYALWSRGFITGGWESKIPEYVQSVYYKSEIQWHYQKHMRHSVHQSEYFLDEALYKLHSEKDYFILHWGEEAYNNIMNGLLNISNLLADQRNQTHQNEAELTEYAMTKKGQSFVRRICLKLKKVIKEMENLLNKDPEVHYNLLRPNHLNKQGSHILVPESMPVLGCDALRTLKIQNWLKSKSV